MTLGETLRLERERRKLSRDEAAQELRVKPAILSAIEADDTGHIPRVYLQGYIRNYARHLGLDADAIECRIGEVRCTEPAIQSVFSVGLPRDRSERWLKATSYVLASAVVIALVWQFTAEAVRFSQGDPMPRTAAVDTSSQVVPGAAQTGDDPVPAAYAPAPPEPVKTHLRASIAAMDSAKSVEPADRRSVAEGAWAALENRAASRGADPGGDAETAVLTITTSADSWVEIVDGNGDRIEMDLLRAGSRRSYSGEKPFRCLLGRAASIELVYNGEPVDLAPHTRGNVARVTLGDGTNGAGQEPAPRMDRS